MLICVEKLEKVTLSVINSKYEYMRKRNKIYFLEGANVRAKERKNIIIITIIIIFLIWLFSQ